MWKIGLRFESDIKLTKCYHSRANKDAYAYSCPTEVKKTFSVQKPCNGYFLILNIILLLEGKNTSLAT